MPVLSTLGAAIANVYGFTSGLIKDQYFNLVSLLLPGNGTNGAQNNTFLDGSSNTFTITRNGNTTQGTFSPFSQTGWGNYFSGDGNYLSSAYSTDWAFSGEFSIEAWINIQDAGRSADATKVGSVVTQGQSGTTTNSWEVFFIISGGVITEIGFGVGGSSVVSNASQSISLNAWHHVAVCRSGSTISFYVDGDRIATNASYSTSISANTSGTLQIARNTYGSPYQSWAKGYFSNIRILKGSSAYSASSSTLTVPKSPLTAVTNTVFLSCQSNRFVDANTQVAAKTITVTGSPSVTPFSPFAPTQAYSAAAVGGSGYFDGTGDYLTGPTSNAAFDLGTGAYTLEAWVYLTSLSTEAIVFCQGNATNALFFSVLTTGALNLGKYGVGAQISTSSGDVPLNSWTHVAIVRTSTATNDTRLYVNGVLKNTGTDNNNWTVNTTPTVGGLTVSGYFVNGYISSFRVVKGTAITPPSGGPTAPLTAVSGTSLLLNFTNAGITDATAKNDLETVGNAQISTTQSKWGGGSMYFDGTGDWLLIPDQPQQRIGTGNFTVEMWVYRNASGTYGLVGKGTGTTGWLVSLNSSNQVVFTYGSSTITSTGTVSATTWTYIAVVREGTGTNQTKIYINGTNDGTGTVNTDFNQTNSMYIGADRTGGSAANAYVQDVRITNYARTITASPTAPFPKQ